MRLISCATAFLMVFSCKSRDEASGTKAIADSSGHVFGLITVPGNGNQAARFEFRFCNSAIHNGPRDQSVNDPRICVNPFLDGSGRPVSITVESFASIEAAESRLRAKGYAKGATVATGGVVAGVVVGYIGGAVLAIPYAATSAIGAAMGSATVSPSLFIGMTYATTAVAGAGGGMLGYSVWGANDRETASKVEAILGDFNKETTTKDVLPVMKAFGKAMGWKTTNNVDSF